MAISIGGGITIGGGIGVAVVPTITITSQPIGQGVYSGASASYSVVATVTAGATLSYQWQVQQGGAGEYSNILGATSSTYIISNVTVANDNGDNFRAVVSATGGATPVSSNSASLTVVPSTISIVSQPSDVSSYPTGTATFSVSATATASATLSYQWQIQQSGIGSWNNILNATSSSYTTGSLTVADDNGDKFRVIVSATKEATPVTSNAATLYVTAAVITINSQPTAQTASPGSTATFSVSASATQAATLSYQWELQAGGSGSWSTILFATDSSYTTGTLSSSDNNNNYRVVVSGTIGATPVTSNSAALTVSAGATNTMTIAESPSYPQYTGASLGYVISAFGTISSDYFNAFFQYSNDPNYEVSAYLTDGTYDGFTVVGGAIGGDLGSYPRYITVNGTQYTFVYNPYAQAYIYNGSLNFPSLIGQTIGISTNGTGPSLTSNSFIVAMYDYGGGQTWYGASNGAASNGSSQGPIYGTMVSDYINTIYANSSGPSVYTQMTLRDGSYTGFSVYNGLIDSDTGGYGGTGSHRIFTIGGTNYEFQAMGNTPNVQYVAQQDTGGIMSSVGSTITLVYDPSQQGAGDNTVNGTMTIGSFGGMQYGWSPNQMGSANLIPGMVFSIKYDGMQTRIYFTSGTYYGVVVDSTSINGETTVTVSIGGIVETGDLSSGGPGCQVYWSGDVFSLVSKNGTTVEVAIDAGTGGGGSTYTVNIDYNDGTMAQPGLDLVHSPSGGDYFAALGASGWLTPAGFEALYALTTGGTFTVTMPSTGATTYTITLSSAWSGSGGNYMTTITSTPTLNVGSGSPPDSVPTTISSIGGGGGGGSSTFTQSGNWGYASWGPGGPGGMMSMSTDPTATSQFISALNAITTSSTITFVSNMYGTSSAMTVQNPITGQPWTAGQSITLYFNTAPPGGQIWNDISTITIGSGGGGGGGTVATGSFTVGYFNPAPGIEYYGGQKDNAFGSLSITPFMVDAIFYDVSINSTLAFFIPGTYGSVVVTSTTVNGSNTVSINAGPGAQQGSLTSSGPYAMWSVPGNPFGIAYNVGASRSVTISTP